MVGLIFGLGRFTRSPLGARGGCTMIGCDLQAAGAGWCSTVRGDTTTRRAHTIVEVLRPSKDGSHKHVAWGHLHGCVMAHGMGTGVRSERGLQRADAGSAERRVCECHVAENPVVGCPVRTLVQYKRCMRQQDVGRKHAESM